MKDNKQSIYDIAFHYTSTFYKKGDVIDKKQIIIDVFNLLSNGWTAEELLTYISKAKKVDSDSIMDLKTYFINLNPQRINLLNPLQFYYHNELRINSDPPIVDFDLNTGEVIRSVPEHVLEMRASYTVEDLHNYYLDKNNLYEKDTLSSNRLMGSLNWLTKNFDIDIVLYMMDAADDIINAKDLNKLKNPMGIQDYYLDAKDTFQRKVTETKILGDDKVVPRKRMLFV